MGREKVLENMHSALNELKTEKKNVESQIASIEKAIRILEASNGERFRKEIERQKKEEEVQQTSDLNIENLVDWANSKQEEEFATKDIMRTFNVSLATARKYIQEGIQQGFIELAQERSRGKGVRYRMT